MELGTFSIAARCARTGMLGTAIATAVPAAGSLASFIRPRIGAIATQSWVNPYLGIDGLELLARGMSANEALATLLRADPGRSSRQVGIVDRDGRSAAHTGSDCTSWHGHIVGDGFSVQGNMLVGPETIQAMELAFLGSREAPLHDRLMYALEAGQAAGGDKRGRQSASLRVFDVEEYPYLDLRVDDHPSPVTELRRVLEVGKIQLLPFTAWLPTREDPNRTLPITVASMLMKSPSDRTVAG